MAALSAEQLEEYIALCFAKEADLGAHYVRRQVEWAEAELESLLLKSSSMDGSGESAARFHAPQICNACRPS